MFFIYLYIFLLLFLLLYFCCCIFLIFSFESFKQQNFGHSIPFSLFKKKNEKQNKKIVFYAIFFNNICLNRKEENSTQIAFSFFLFVFLFLMIFFLLFRVFFIDELKTKTKKTNKTIYRK